MVKKLSSPGGRFLISFLFPRDAFLFLKEKSLRCFSFLCFLGVILPLRLPIFFLYCRVRKKISSDLLSFSPGNRAILPFGVDKNPPQCHQSHYLAKWLISANCVNFEISRWSKKEDRCVIMISKVWLRDEEDGGGDEQVQEWVDQQGILFIPQGSFQVRE